MFKYSEKFKENRVWLAERRVCDITIIAIASVLILSISEARSRSFDDFIERQSNIEMEVVIDNLSNQQSNTPNPVNTNQLAFEGPELNATFKIAGRDINQDNLQDNGKIDVPTGAAPSHLFEAQPFTQQMLRFEEFGPVPLGEEGSTFEGDPFPSPENSVSVPDEQALDDFLRQYISPDQALPFPFPTRIANDPDNGGTDENPWKVQIEEFLGRDLHTPPAEGRPPGEGWAHQRFEEFFPQVYYNTAQAGARTNTGFRDPLQ